MHPDHYVSIRKNRHLGSEHKLCKKKKHAWPGHHASTAEAAPGRPDRVGIGEHDESVSGRNVHLIAFPRQHGSKVRLRKAEERSQHTTKILHIFIYRPGNPRALRASRPFYRCEVDPFVGLFRHRARLPRRHPGRAYTAACSRARAAGVVTEVCQTVKTSASPLICSKT